MRTGRAIRVAALLVLPLVLAGCPGKDETGIFDPQERLLLFRLNASENDGETVRWRTLPVQVFLGDVGQPDEVNEWTRATEGKVTFAFVASRPESGISFRKESLGSDVCGVANIEFDDGQIFLADVRVNPAIYRGPGCVRTVTHEAGHAIGILNHTSDGGLMDSDGGDGRITSQVAEMVRNLYSIEPGARVGLIEGRRGSARRVGGRYRITIIDRAKP